MATIKGQDWSSYQSATPSTAGLSFVFIKATEGAGYVNPRMTAQAAHARKAGLIVGFYHFLRPGNMKAQAAFFVDRAVSLEGDPLAADWEDSLVSNADKNAFIAEVIRLRGSSHKVGLYCNVNFWKNKDVGSKCGDFLWIAHYTTAGKPGISDKWLIHQYDQGTPEDKVDHNVAAFASKAAMRAWADKEPVSPKPTTPAPKPATPKPATPKPSASQAAKVIAMALTQVGVKETKSGGAWVNDSKYNKWYGSIPGYPRNGMDYPWCAVFVAWVAAQVGAASLYPKTAGCATAVNWFRNKGRFSDYPSVGAQVFFGPGGGTHTGLVIAYTATTITTVEGNTNTNGSANGDGVYRRTRLRKDANTYGYGMPAFAEGITTADPALKGKKGYTYKATASAPATSAPATPKTLMEEVESMTAKQVNDSVWNVDSIPAPPSASTFKTNPTWKASAYLKELWERQHETLTKLDALTKAVAALAAKVEESQKHVVIEVDHDAPAGS